MAKQPITFEGFIAKFRKQVRDSYQSVGEAMLAGGAKNMETYNYMLGQAHAYKMIDQDISNLLSPKEDKKNDTEGTNVIKFDGNTKD